MDIAKMLKQELSEEYFEKKENSKLNMAKVNMRISREIKNFILQGGFSINL